MPDVAGVSRQVPWREAAKDVDALRPMLLEQVRHEDLRGRRVLDVGTGEGRLAFVAASVGARVIGERDRKSTRLNSSHSQISYAVFCLKKKIQPILTCLLSLTKCLTIS